MKQVDFYLISNQVNNAKFKLASRLANKIQRGVGQRDVLFQGRPMAAPFRNPVAQYQRSVALAEQELKKRHHMFPASSGKS